MYKVQNMVLLSHPKGMSVYRDYANKHLTVSVTDEEESVDELPRVQH